MLEAINQALSTPEAPRPVYAGWTLERQAERAASQARIMAQGEGLLCETDEVTAPQRHRMAIACIEGFLDGILRRAEYPKALTEYCLDGIPAIRDAVQVVKDGLKK
jgi:hypothetical protein